MPNIAPQWKCVELTFSAVGEYANPYTDLQVWGIFRHENGKEYRRPGFWDGGKTWKIRFTSPFAEGHWTYEIFSSPNDAGLRQTGQMAATANQSNHLFYRHGFWTIPPGGRNLRHADGKPALLVADTAWALPWRATLEQCQIYAKDRQSKGFNAVLLMSVQPDMKAVGPRSRTELDGFDVGFEDLPTGHINQINISYFQYFDRLAQILIEHEIVPVYQPVFHGYGWKGLQVAGAVIPPEEYARYCRYLVARYGAMPAMWLVSADGDGYAPGVTPGGWEIEYWDCYQQPAGIHYAPHQHPVAHQHSPWLDFQWCQTGHNGLHVPERVASMREKLPVKAIANGEPTYENIGKPGRAAGWWQGHEAWCNLCAGGTMGIVYGAGSLWQWRLSKREIHQDWCMAKDADWLEAMHFEGSRYIGIVGKIFQGLDFAEMEPDYLYTFGLRGLRVPGQLLIVYQEEGSDFQLARVHGIPHEYRVVNPLTGDALHLGTINPSQPMVKVPPGGPRVIVFTHSVATSSDKP